MKHHTKSIFAAILLMAAAVADATTVDFSGGTPIGATLIQNKLIVGSYQFSEINGTLSISQEGRFQTFGLAAPMQGSPASLSISRIDGQTFSLTEIDPFVAGTLVTGAVDFQLTPFDAAGTELAPVALQAGQFQTNISVTSTLYPTLNNITSFRISNSLIDHFTRFSFTSASDTPSVPEQNSGVLFLLGAIAFGLIRKKSQ